ncbi:MAG: outer membrane lipoprotein-sorting protein [Candidatus Sabulitectum sp.]|nr:outer membrane lipoprotein-sorting protein [Candidatus Sabulitectum sp.]
MSILIIALVVITSAVTAQPALTDVLHELDQLYRSDNSHSEMSMHIVTEHWERTLTMETWSSGRDKTFIKVLSPVRQAGSATLRIGSEMWNYLPNTNSTVRIPPSMMTGSWMGSDITNNDIVKEITYANDYTAEYITEQDTTGEQHSGQYYLKLTPNASTAVVWSYIICAISTDPVLPVWEEYYDRHDNLIKTVIFSDVRTMGGRTIPTVMQVIPADKPDQSTTITWSNTSFDQGVSEDIFSLDNLQAGGNL